MGKAERIPRGKVRRRTAAGQKRVRARATPTEISAIVEFAQFPGFTEFEERWFAEGEMLHLAEFEPPWLVDKA